MTSAFEAFNRGDLAAADASYRRALAAEPANADALLGLAAVALRLGAPERAENFFRRAVEVDPRNAASQAGLMAFRIEGDPTASVTRLKSLLAAQPDEPSLHFQLGNALAAAERWHDAQQAFLGACGLASDQPDYLYNLGVAFDRLRNADLARHYYERALTAARQRPAAFDIAAVTARIHELTDRHE